MLNNSELKESFINEKLNLQKQVSSLKKFLSGYKAERKVSWKEFRKKLKDDVERIEQSSKALSKQFKSYGLKKSSHTYSVNGMVCAGCAKIIEHKLTEVPGVAFVKVNLKKQKIKISSFQLLQLNALQQSLNNTGYTIAEPAAQSLVNHN